MVEVLYASLQAASAVLLSNEHVLTIASPAVSGEGEEMLKAAHSVRYRRGERRDQLSTS